jgi:hypothetical protein
VLTRHDPELAAEVLGATEALREQLDAPIPPVEAPDRDAAVAVLGRKLGAAKLEPAWSEGRAARSTASSTEPSRRSTRSTAPPPGTRRRRST